MIPEIAKAYRSGRLLLLLGAGASAGSYDAANTELPMSSALAAELAGLMGWPYANEPLSNVYSAVNAVDASRLQLHLRERLTNTRPSAALRTLAAFPWSRVFTLNIDDCAESAFRSARAQTVMVFDRNAPLEEVDPIFQTVQIIKLNGSADHPENGFIFSPQEYGAGSSRLPVWYREMAQNNSHYTFLFLGSTLSEPLFQHALSEMRSVVKRSPQRGYVVTPHASEIDRHHLSSLNLLHIPATINDFADWLAQEFPRRPAGWDLAVARRPELKNVGTELSTMQKRALNSVTLVSPETVPLSSAAPGAIREFYRGYKPRWQDIVDEVPAQLSFSKRFAELVAMSHKPKRCIVLTGPAGSGKSTALMSAALHASKTSQKPVYYLREETIGLKSVVVELERLNHSPFYLFIDKVESFHVDIAELLNGPETKNICLVAAERLNIWSRRVKRVLDPVVSQTVQVERISIADAKSILQKLEQFGAWTRFRPLTPEQRVAEIYNKADRQLLIGLMEATTGLGFTQIIDRDFRGAGDDRHKQFLVVVGFASIHRSTLSASIVGLALSNLGISEDINDLASETAGIVTASGDRFAARHPVYVRELFEKIVSTSMIRDCLVAVLKAFASYETPVIKHVGKSDGIVFKSIINHRFVTGMLRNDEIKVRSVYETFETSFHVDGLYWLQYGLALRAFEHQDEALDKFKTARDAYSSRQIDHAYAQH